MSSKVCNKWRHWKDHGGQTALVTPSWGDTRAKINFFVAEFWKKLDKRRGKMGVMRRQLKKVTTFRDDDEKRPSDF